MGFFNSNYKRYRLLIFVSRGTLFFFAILLVNSSGENVGHEDIRSEIICIRTKIQNDTSPVLLVAKQLLYALEPACF